MSISTGTGDKGNTSLFDGTKISKNSKTISAVGIADELNAILGLVLSKHSSEKLEIVQHELFIVGSDIATPSNSQHEHRTKRIQKRHTERLETELKSLEENVGPLKGFVIPGGNEVSSLLHVARTTTRKLERATVKNLDEREINVELIKYLNRLSDYLFMYALNHNRENEIKEKNVDFEI